MKTNVIEEKENPLLKRKELLISVDYEGKSTPSKAELQKLLAQEMNANIENLEISKVLSETGLSRGKAWIKVWDEKKVEVYVDKSKKAEEGQEAPAEETKTEEVKEVPSEAVEEAKPEEAKEEPKEGE